MEEKSHSKIMKLVASLKPVEFVILISIFFAISLVIGWNLRSGEVDQLRGDLIMCTLLGG